MSWSHALVNRRDRRLEAVVEGSEAFLNASRDLAVPNSLREDQPTVSNSSKKPPICRLRSTKWISKIQ